MFVKYKVLAVSGSKIIIQVAHLERTFDIDGFLHEDLAQRSEAFERRLLDAVCDECNTRRHQKLPITIFEKSSEDFCSKLKIPCNVALKVLLWNELLRRQMNWTDLGKLVKLNVTQMSRIANFRYSSKVEMIEKCFNALNLDVKCSLV